MLVEYVSTDQITSAVCRSKIIFRGGEKYVFFISIAPSDPETT